MLAPRRLPLLALALVPVPGRAAKASPPLMPFDDGVRAFAFVVAPSDGPACAGRLVVSPLGAVAGRQRWSACFGDGAPCLRLTVDADGRIASWEAAGEVPARAPRLVALWPMLARRAAGSGAAAESWPLSGEEDAARLSATGEWRDERGDRSWTATLDSALSGLEVVGSYTERRAAREGSLSWELGLSACAGDACVEIEERGRLTEIPVPTALMAGGTVGPVERHAAEGSATALIEALRASASWPGWACG